jgi:hypothetical protein
VRSIYTFMSQAVVFHSILIFIGCSSRPISTVRTDFRLTFLTAATYCLAQVFVPNDRANMLATGVFRLLQTSHQPHHAQMAVFLSRLLLTGSTKPYIPLQILTSAQAIFE